MTTLDEVLKLGRDVTAEARKHAVGPVIGRAAELDELLATLSQRTRTSVVLVGSPGVGRTCLVEALALRIVSGRCPPALRDKRIVEIPVADLMATAQAAGEKAADLLAKAVEAEPELLPFLPGAHASPDVLRGAISAIGTATPRAWERLKPLWRGPARRIHMLAVEEPSRDEALAILRGVKSRVEEHYGLSIADHILESVLDASIQVLPERKLPAKALELLEFLCSRRVLDALREVGEPDAAAPSFGNAVSLDAVAAVVSEVRRDRATTLAAVQRRVAQKLPTVSVEGASGPSAAELIAAVMERVGAARVGEEDLQALVDEEMADVPSRPARPKAVTVYGAVNRVAPSRIQAALLLLDIVSSTKLLKAAGATVMSDAVLNVMAAVKRHPSAGHMSFCQCTGDGLFAVFPKVEDALEVARNPMKMERTEGGEEILFRRVIHFGEIKPSAGGQPFGSEVHRLFRVEGVAEKDRLPSDGIHEPLPVHGRVVVTAAAHQSLPEGVRRKFSRVGLFNVKDFESVELMVDAAGASGRPEVAPPPASAAAAPAAHGLVSAAEAKAAGQFSLSTYVVVRPKGRSVALKAAIAVIVMALFAAIGVFVVWTIKGSEETDDVTDVEDVDEVDEADEADEADEVDDVDDAKDVARAPSSDTPAPRTPAPADPPSSAKPVPGATSAPESPTSGSVTFAGASASLGPPPASDSLLAGPSSWSGAIDDGLSTCTTTISLKLLGSETGVVAKVVDSRTFTGGAVEIPDGESKCTIRYESDASGTVSDTTLALRVRIGRVSSTCRPGAGMESGTFLDARCTLKGGKLACGGAYPGTLGRK